MSLIEEALRRIKDPTLSKTTAPPAIATPPPASSAIEPRPAHPWSLPNANVISAALTQPLVGLRRFRNSLMLGLIAIGLFCSYWAFSARLRTQHLSHQTPSTSFAPAAAGQLSPSATTIPSVQAPALAPRAAFILNGIVRGSGEPYAMIDGRLLRIGQSINEWTVLSIGQDAVTLQGAGGEMRTLRLVN